MIYFIQAGEGGPIKIGFAESVTKRFRTLQTGHHEKLVLLTYLDGNVRQERRLHREFRAARIRGEWFRPTPELLAFIAAPEVPPLPSAPTGYGMKLDAWAKREGLTDSELAKRLGVSQPTANRLRSGQRRPGWDVLRRIREVTDSQVTDEDFFTVPEPPQGEDAAPAAPSDANPIPVSSEKVA